MISPGKGENEIKTGSFAWKYATSSSHSIRSPDGFCNSHPEGRASGAWGTAQIMTTNTFNMPPPSPKPLAVFAAFPLTFLKPRRHVCPQALVTVVNITVCGGGREAETVVLPKEEVRSLTILVGRPHLRAHSQCRQWRGRHVHYGPTNTWNTDFHCLPGDARRACSKPIYPRSRSAYRHLGQSLDQSPRGDSGCANRAATETSS